MRSQISNSPPPARFRDRVFPVLTIQVALLWILGAWFAARHVGTVNAARALGALMTAHMANAPPVSTSGRPNLFSAIIAAQAVTPEQRAAQEQTARQIASVEVILYAWERGVWIAACVLDLLALLAVLTGRIRSFHLTAAAIILLSTLGTLVAMRLLIHPAYGGMPPLRPLSYILVGIAQGSYALILLLAFWRRPRPAPPPVLD